MSEDFEEKRKILRRAEDSCPHYCSVCSRYNLQMKWIITGAIIFLGIVITNKADISALSKDAGIAKLQAEYTIQSVNDIKKAMGLEIRMPPKLEALK